MGLGERGGIERQPLIERGDDLGHRVFDGRQRLSSAEHALENAVAERPF